MLDLQKRRVQLALIIGGIIVLSMTAEKFRELVGDEASSKSGKFTFLNCFDMGSGSMACAAKEGVKLYVYSIRSAHVEKVRQHATEIALTEALTGGLSASAAAKEAQKAGTKAAKQATRQAKRITGPIISSGWDFFEAIYYGGTMTEGFLRGIGTLLGTYAGGFHGEERLGKLGYLMGSHLGSWVGGRIGLMVYDVVNGLHYLLQFVQPEENTSLSTADENSGSEDAYNAEEDRGYYQTREKTSEDSAYYQTRDENTEDSGYYQTQEENSESSEGWSFF
ncbi:hypothetical protein J5N97_015385 [Dioscorea zingiberensis]|uniref:Uncharacterized protein n=1 Tax=Dioscorea zingiberensis TaxID=325984 RepID=A0A9D5CU84_9LILI|nr:hypothetical protein J5N97_015385 [Dioscorea zingiberensis]